jgi:hypothetical protein
MAFQVEECAVELNVVVQPLVLRVLRRDRALADQLSRSAASVALNISEGNGSDPGNRLARFFTASGSARRRGPRCESASGGATSSPKMRSQHWHYWTASSPCCGASRASSCKAARGADEIRAARCHALRPAALAR